MAEQAQELRVIAPDQYELHYMVTQATTVALVRFVITGIRGFPEAGLEAKLGIGPDFIAVPDDDLLLWEAATNRHTLVFHLTGHIPKFVDNGDDADGDQEWANKKVVIVLATDDGGAGAD